MDDEQVALKAALLEVAQTGHANFRFTCNQNVILADINNEDKPAIQEILERFKIIQHTDNASTIRGNAVACVALNTCALALAESQRYLPTLISKIEPLLQKHGLENEEIILRMSGCPNGCSRPFAAELGFVGTALGKYNMHIGGDRFGMRLNKLYKESLDEEQILSELDFLFNEFKQQREAEETFGDFTHRTYCNG